MALASETMRTFGEVDPNHLRLEEDEQDELCISAEFAAACGTDDPTEVERALIGLDIHRLIGLEEFIRGAQRALSNGT